MLTQKTWVSIVSAPIFLLFATFLSCVAIASEPAYQPTPQKVVDNVYAIIGPLGQRSQANAGLNASYGTRARKITDGWAWLLCKQGC